MPKVKEEYFEKKRNDILDAALAVCMRKAVYEVSMSDIVKEMKASRGGIYKYFENIDEVLIALVNREGSRFEGNDVSRIEQILQAQKKPEQVLVDLFDYSTERVLAAFNVYGKIFLDMDIPLANDPERSQAFHSRIEENARFVYLSGHIFTFITEKTREGYFHPLLPLSEITSFIIASFDGIVGDVLYSNYYSFKEGTPDYEFNGEKLIAALCKSVILLLNGDHTVLA
ncbi:MULTISPECIES: TetR/AcrR family transcriptional regulator [Enterococcus]|uniref:TetR family transcriptional regulator n=1 Tax=Candidatus Enterococcus murrayae TaxID=2815321 RepID=A0ABS3HFW0_9ENTE|nr:TetR family transcriptional regulator [Enterococcus sp. MJM16]MBO0451473.1 TetR family transcriptional regulator [Enterococcus sp. MJM16]